MLREGKHGLVEEGQGETKAQVKDVPGLIIQLFWQKIFREYKQSICCYTLFYWKMHKINSNLLHSINH